MKYKKALARFINTTQKVALSFFPRENRALAPQEIQQSHRASAPGLSSFKPIGTLSAPSFVFIAVCALSHFAYAQAAPAGTQQLQLSAFAGLTGTFTDLSGGKNLGITAGADLTFLSFRLFRPSFEARGTYPIDGGHISSQKNFLLGPKVEYPIGRVHPYADILFGRGQIDYHAPGYIFGDTIFLSTNTFIYSPGIGLDYNLTHNLAAKADVQFQHWNTAAVPSGAIHPTAITFGAVYTFDFNPRHRHND